MNRSPNDRQALMAPFSGQSPAGLEYSACHEAGHAVVRMINGEEILSVDACARATCFRGKDWQCSCGGHLKTEPDCRFTYNFNPDCDTCTAYVTSLVGANYSGDAATAGLMPDQHKLLHAGHDLIAAEEFASPYSNDRIKWHEIERAAERWANELVVRESKAILELRDALVRAGGWLDGPDAQRIISANLTRG